MHDFYQAAIVKDETIFYDFVVCTRFIVNNFVSIRDEFPRRTKQVISLFVYSVENIFL